MEQNIDTNILIQVLSEKVSQLMNDIILKDTLIRQLSQQLSLNNTDNVKEKNV